MNAESILAMIDCQIADREDRARRYIRKAGKERKRRGAPQTTAERMSEYHCHRLDELKQIRAWVAARSAVDVEALVTSCEQAGRRLCFEDPQATEIMRKAAAMLIRLSGNGGAA